jgi:hypothetical protein
MSSPYDGLPTAKWQSKTEELISRHPLKPDEIVEVTLKAWQDIFLSSIGNRGFKIGQHIFPKPQIMPVLLHELIPLEFSDRYPKIWRAEKGGGEKDLMCISDPSFSVEIKTSSHATKIFGNRSYAQVETNPKKAKSGYYLAINFEKFSAESEIPVITGIRFGWLDHSDWTGQASQTGQQAHLSGEAEKYKLLKLYPK